MGPDEREKTLERIVRVRGVEGTAPLSSAARALGLSRSALSGWIASDDLPVVITKQGRREMPIPVLQGLCEQVGEKRGPGDPLQALKSVMLEERQRVERLRPRFKPSDGEDRPDPHRVAELRSLAYHRAVALQLRRQTVEEAQRKLRRWREEGKVDPRYAHAWEEAFALPLTEMRKVITADDERGRDLRQNSPLAGLLSEPERRKLLAIGTTGAHADGS